MNKEIFDSRMEILDNGINLITIKRNTQIASIQAGIKVGAIYEKKKEKGISHFVEHMLFKGTKNRSNEKLNDELEERGGEYNAYTDHSSTVYSITALKDELKISIELISDMLQNSIFPESEMEKERGVILAEIRTSKDDVEDYSFKRVNEIAFDKSPLRYDTIGTEKTVKSFTREQLLSFYDKHYIPNNCYISIVSPFSHEEVLNTVKKHFKDWERKELKKDRIIVEENKAIKEVSYKVDIEQSTIIYAFTFHNLTREEELALKILNNKFGESSNSILFRELREERGLAYDVYSEMDVTKNIKILYIYTAVSAENVDETLEIIDKSIEGIKSEKIDFNENTIALMKKVLKTAVAATLEDSTDLCNYVLHQMLDGESIYEFLEDMKNMETIKREEIYNTARKVFDKPTIHILLPENMESE